MLGALDILDCRSIRYSSDSYALLVMKPCSSALSCEPDVFPVWVMITELAEASEVISGLMYFIGFHLLSLLDFSAEISVGSDYSIVCSLNERH
jgi:hypothetical protein